MNKQLVQEAYRNGISETLHDVGKNRANLALKLAARRSAHGESGFILAVSVVHQSSTGGADSVRSLVVQGDGERLHVVLGKPGSQERNLESKHKCTYNNYY